MTKVWVYIFCELNKHVFNMQLFSIRVCFIKIYLDMIFFFLNVIPNK